MNTPLVAVTGAGSGIGEAIAREFARRGYHVVVTDVDESSAQRVAGGLASAQAHRLDVTDPDACEAMVRAIVAEHHRLDVWVSNAGISKMQHFVETSPEDLARNFEVNTYGVFYCGQSAARAMIDVVYTPKMNGTRLSNCASTAAPTSLRCDVVRGR